MWREVCPVSTGIFISLFALMTLYQALKPKNRKAGWRVTQTFTPRRVLSSTLVTAAAITACWLLVRLPYLNNNPLIWLGWKLFGWGNGSFNASVLLQGLPRGWFMLALLPFCLMAVPVTVIGEQLNRHHLPTRVMGKDGKLKKVDRSMELNSTVPVEANYGWKQIITHTLTGSLSYMLFLLPLGAVIGLMVCNLWVNWHYARGGLKASVSYGSIVNILLTTYVVAAFLV